VYIVACSYIVIVQTFTFLMTAKFYHKTTFFFRLHSLQFLDLTFTEFTFHLRWLLEMCKIGVALYRLSQNMNYANIHN